MLGPNEVWLYPSVEAEARGWAAAMSGAFRMELRQTGRVERNRHWQRTRLEPSNSPITGTAVHGATGVDRAKTQTTSASRRSPGRYHQMSRSRRT